MYLTDSDEPSFFPNPVGLAVSVLCAVMLVGMLVFGWGPLDRLTKSYAKLYLGDATTTNATRTASLSQ
jgi:hypothetical protein